MAEFLTIPQTASIYSEFKAGDSVFCITVKELVSCGFPENTIILGLHRQRKGGAYCWAHHKQGKTVFIHYDYLKPHYKATIKAVLLNGLEPVEWWNIYKKDNTQIEKIIGDVVMDCPDEKEIISLTLPTGEHLPEKERAKLRTASIWINFLIDYESKSAVKSLGYKNTTAFYNDVIKYFQKRDIKLPCSYGKLRAKVREYKENGINALVDLRLKQNINAAKIKTDEQISVLFRVMTHHNALDAAKIAAPYNVIANLMGWEEVSRRTILEYMKKYKFFITAIREGKRAFRDKLAMQIKRSRPSIPLAFWSLDGWKAELFYQKTVYKNGNAVRTFHNRLVIYIVLDCYNDYPVGFAIGETETAELAREALKNAADHVNELFGGYYRPHQIQSDRAALKTLKPIFSEMAEYFTPAAVGNAKSKPVERFNRTLIDNSCIYYDNFAGYGVKSKKQPNADILNVLKKGFPDKQGLINQLTFIVNKERASRRDAFLTAWGDVPEQKRLNLSREQYLFLFGDTTARPIRFNGRGICPTINHKVIEYETFDMSLRTNLFTAWNIYYDENDLNSVLAVSNDEKKRILLKAKHIQPTALIDRKEGDAEALRKVYEFNKNLENIVSAELGKLHQKSKEVLENINLDALDDKTAAIMITDSKGQHKDYTFGNVDEQPTLKTQKANNARGQRKARKKKDKNPLDAEHWKFLENKVDVSAYKELQF